MSRATVLLRGIVGVIVGYFVSAIWVMLALTVAWKVLGASFAYKEGTLEVATGWSVMALVLGFVGAVLAGFVTAVIAPSPTGVPVKVLAGIVLALGLALAVAHLFDDDETAEPSKAPEEMTAFEAASESVAPIWYDFTIPVVGCLGVLIGGGLRRRPAGVAGGGT
jgi:hypothetical protein